jgi:hypothetical protein
MKNIQILGAGMSNRVFTVLVVVKPTGKEFALTGVKAERLVRKFGLWESKQESD